MGKQVVSQMDECGGIRVSMSADQLDKLPPAAKMVVYEHLQGLSARQAALKAGYSPSTDAWQVKKSKHYQHALQTVEQQIEAVRSKYPLAPLIRRLDSLSRHAVNEETSRKATNDMINHLGYSSPQRVEVSQSTMVAQFNHVSTGSLTDMKKAIKRLRAKLNGQPVEVEAQVIDD
jgi:hypothetical protein